jgi:hypothetical protein
VNPRLKRAWHEPDAGDQDENPAWKPKLKDYLCGWDLSDADIDTVLLRCQVDPVLRGEYRLEASVGGAGWHRLMAECRPCSSVGWGG